MGNIASPEQDIGPKEKGRKEQNILPTDLAHDNSS